jgi:uncharacterized NAD-dependent epimerase/dehydratase family protein
VARRLLVLTEGRTDPVTAKTAVCLIRYSHDTVVALLDSTRAGESAQEALGVGKGIPIVGRLQDADSPDTLVIGIAASGGKIPPAWRSVLLEAVSRGMNIVSGMHEMLKDDPELVARAKERGVQLIDVRDNHEFDVATGTGFREGCLRIHTVGNDCSVGKMVVSLELARAIPQRGLSAKFLATGQTGIMIEGDGCPVDHVISDFLNGAVEKLVQKHQHHDIVMLEGQGCISHPKYSPVTLGLLHGGRPHGLILCYEMGRTQVHGMPGATLLDLQRLRVAYEMITGLVFPTRVIGVAINSRRVDATAAAAERQRIESEMGLPACDIIRHGPNALVDAILNFRQDLPKPWN